MRILHAIFCICLVCGILLYEKSSAADLGELQSKLLSLTEAITSAEKAGDAERMAVLSSQWSDISPVISQDLGLFFDQSVTKISADLKKYRAKLNDGSLSERTSQIYSQMATRMQDTLKSLMTLRNQTKVMSEKLNETMRTIAERPDVKSLIDANKAKKKASESLQAVDDALEKLRKLQQ